jgi:hypothetical protein
LTIALAEIHKKEHILAALKAALSIRYYRQQTALSLIRNMRQQRAVILAVLQMTAEITSRVDLILLLQH